MTKSEPGNTKRIRAATIGCGRMGAIESKPGANGPDQFWSPISHLGALGHFDDIDIVACCDVDEGAAQRAQNMYGIPDAYTDAGRMINETKIDLLTIATRTPEKRRLIDLALDAGIRALHVEKPLCNSVSELLHIRKRLDETGAAMSFGCLRRYLPPYRQISDLSLSDWFGQLQHIQLDMGRRELFWTQIHAIDLMLYYAGGARPVSVQGWFDKVELVKGRQWHVTNDPLLISATVLFDNGVTAHIGQSSGLAVTLSSASARLELFGNGSQLFVARPKTPGGILVRTEAEIEQTAGYGGTAAPIAMLKDSLGQLQSATGQTAINQADMLCAQQLAFALIASHMDGGRIRSVEDLPPELCVHGFTNGVPA